MSRLLPTSTSAPQSANCARCRRYRSGILLRPGLRWSEWQAQSGDKAALRMIAQFQLAAMPLGGAAGNGQAQTVTAAGLARGAVEGFAKAGQQLRCNARAVITHAQA